MKLRTFPQTYFITEFHGTLKPTTTEVWHECRVWR
jgi:hypothetical protein